MKRPSALITPFHKYDHVCGVLSVGIDPQARANILEFVRKLGAEGTAILYTTHYLEEAETLCSRIGIIDHGKLLAEGTLLELQKRLAGDQLFVLEGNLQQANPDDWPGFRERFRIIQKSDHQLVVLALFAAGANIGAAKMFRY